MYNYYFLYTFIIFRYTSTNNDRKFIEYTIWITFQRLLFFKRQSTQRMFYIIHWMSKRIKHLSTTFQKKNSLHRIIRTRHFPKMSNINDDSMHSRLHHSVYRWKETKHGIDLVTSLIMRVIISAFLKKSRRSILSGWL